MNFGFRYNSSLAFPYTAETVAASPWSRLVFNGTTSIFQNPNPPFSATDVLNFPGSRVTDAYYYLDMTKILEGMDSFERISPDDKTLVVPNAELPIQVWDIDPWKDPVLEVLKSEIDLARELGFTGLFLDDFGTYCSRKAEIAAETGLRYDGDELRNAALAVMDAASSLAEYAPDLDVIVNADAYLISSAVRFGDEGVYRSHVDDEIERFAASVDSIVIENYVTARTLGSFDQALEIFASYGFKVFVSDDFLWPEDFADFDRKAVIDYFTEAASRGYIPTAAPIQPDRYTDGENSTGLYDRFPPDGFPVLNRITGLSDVWIGSDGADSIRGLGGGDRLFGSGGDDTQFGGGGRDWIRAEDGNDRLAGNSSADTLEGGHGRDKLFGGRGDDLLDGGGGKDVLAGNAGANIFVFQGSFGFDIVTDMTPGEDMLRFVTGNGEAEDFAAFLAASEQSGNRAVYDLGDDGLRRIVLRGVDLDDLTPDDIDFV